jgi:nucleotide-binding universal stress UspA family protein
MAVIPPELALPLRFVTAADVDGRRDTCVVPRSSDPRANRGIRASTSRQSKCDYERKEEAMSTIVVGVDGSKGSIAALKFAIAEARIRGSEVKAVAAWEVPGVAYGTGLAPIAVDPGVYETIAQDALNVSLDQAAGSSDVSVTPIVREGQPADVLAAEAHGADLLVVGSRGLGGFKGLLLGSVSQQCAHHAPCPVAIVPNGSRPG